MSKAIGVDQANNEANQQEMSERAVIAITEA